MFNNPKKEAKGQNQFRVQEVQSGRQARGQGRLNGKAGGYGVQKPGKGQKPGGLGKENISRIRGKSLVDLKAYKTNWHRET